MARAPDPEVLRDLQNEIEGFVRSRVHPIVVENDVELFDLTSASWRLTRQFDKLLFEVWNSARSLARRVEEVAYRDSGKLGLFVRRGHARETNVLELRELKLREREGRERGRAAFRKEFTAMLAREFPGWRFERISNRSDREHSFSTWYTRGWARQGRNAWAFIGLSEEEPPAAADAVLAFSLIWLDWLRGRSSKTVVPGLRVYLPHLAVGLSAQRAASINRRAVHLDLYEWNSGEQRPQAVDLASAGNVEVRLVPRRPQESVVNRHRERLRAFLGDDVDRLTLVAETSRALTSVRVAGLEVARVEGDLSPRVYFGLEGSVRRLDEKHPREFHAFVTHVLSHRCVSSPDASNPFYRLQSERWLESMLVEDITKIEPSFSPDFVYSQVPAFSNEDRGVIDLLTVTRGGRLAVIELKLHEEINLLFQTLDYWLRVERLRQERKFEEFGYFPGVPLADASPLLYLVVPAFRFHSTTTRLLRYLSPSLAVTQVGINENWRQGIKVLFKREG